MRDHKFASLNLVIIEDIAKAQIVNAMEKELQSWLNRYPMPLFVSAFDDKNDLLHFDEITPCNHLMGFLDKDGVVDMQWRLLKNDEIPNVALKSRIC